LLQDRALVARLVAAAPAVKSIAEDAREWEERYRRLLQPSDVMEGVFR